MAIAINNCQQKYILHIFSTQIWPINVQLHIKIQLP